MTKEFREAFHYDNFLDMLGGKENNLSRNYPFYPLTAPGMPPPGPDFLAQANQLFEDSEAALLKGIDTEDMDLTRRERKALLDRLRQSKRMEKVSYLYYRALYDDEFALNIASKGRLHNARFILGHLWHYVPDGPRQAKVMVIGKCPGRDEHEHARNFVGPTSELFEEALEEVGLSNHDDWYMDNLVRFLSPQSHISSTLATSWIKDCMPLLHQTIMLIRPEFILCLGAESIKSVLGDKSVSYKATNGKVLDLKIPLGKEEYHHAKVVTCIHPAAVARRPELRDDLINSLVFFKKALDGQVDLTSDREHCEHLIINNVADLEQLVRRLLLERRTEFAIDCEWHGRSPVNGRLHTLQFSWEERKAAVLTFCSQGGKPAFQGSMERVVHLLTALFKGSNKRLIGHYFAADLPWLMDLGLDFVIDQFRAPVDDHNPDGVNWFFGWQKTKTKGGFDTILAAHAHEETADFNLKELAVRHTTVPNYETELIRWRKKYCADQGITEKQLEGYGECPDEILWPYALYDADSTFRLYRKYNNQLLDCDRYSNNCRLPFWIAMRALPAFLEMSMKGVQVNVDKVRKFTEIFKNCYTILLDQLREEIHWPKFNIASSQQCRELLFGEHYSNKIDKATGECLSVRPVGALTLNLPPYKSTGRRPKLWTKVRQRREEEMYTPSTDKEVLAAYSSLHPVVSQMLSLRFVEQLLKTHLKPPDTKIRVQADGYDGDDEEVIHENGIISYVESDGRVRAHFSQTKETGRASAWQPNLHAISSRREKDYRKILGELYPGPLRSIFEAKPGCVLIEADYTGAELYTMAIQAGDGNMIDHCQRSNLPESDPNYYDIHAAVAVEAFKILDKDGKPCRPSKKLLEDLGFGHLRTAAKPVDFGYAYGMTADTAQRRAREEGVLVTIQEAEQLIAGLEAKYPMLPPYYAECRQRSQYPGWLCTCFGRYRRFHRTSDRQAQGEQERQAMNMPIQGGVADVMQRALDHIYHYRRGRPWLTYDIILQVHDSVMLEVPYASVEEVHDEVLPKCMTEMVDIWPCYLDGTRREDPRAPYHLDIERKVMLAWGEPLYKDDARRLGILERFGKERKEVKK